MPRPYREEMYLHIHGLEGRECWGAVNPRQFEMKAVIRDLLHAKKLTGVRLYESIYSPARCRWLMEKEKQAQKVRRRGQPRTLRGVPGGSDPEMSDESWEELEKLTRPGS